MMRCIDSGNLITIASLIDGRITDCISAWIYIPDNLIISGKKLVEIINITKNEILAVMQNDSLLKEIFSKEYESAPANRIYKNQILINMHIDIMAKDVIMSYGNYWITSISHIISSIRVSFHR